MGELSVGARLQRYARDKNPVSTQNSRSGPRISGQEYRVAHVWCKEVPDSSVVDLEGDHAATAENTWLKRLGDRRVARGRRGGLVDCGVLAAHCCPEFATSISRKSY